jgi:hypothetical protein
LNRREVFRASLVHPFVIVSVVTCVLMERLWSVQRRERLISAGMRWGLTLYPFRRMWMESRRVGGTGSAGR